MIRRPGRSTGAMVLGLGGVLLLALPSRAAPNDRQFTYLATSDLYAWTSVFRRVGPAGPAGELAPLGNFYIVAAGKTITMSLDDYATPDGGTVYVKISNGLSHAQPFRGCMPVRKKLTITGIVPNKGFFVSIGGIGTGCSSPGAAGRAILGGLK